MSTTDPIVPAPGGEGAGDNPPAPTPAPAAAAPEATPVAPAVSEEETVTLKKSDYEAHLGRISATDKKEARLNKFAQKIGYGKSHFSQSAQPAAAPVAPSPEEAAEAASVEDRKAERGITRLALDPSYRAALDADPTFRDILSQNPLSLLDIYAPDALDAEDAVEQMKEELDRRAALASKPEPAAPAAPAPAPAPAEVPPAGHGSMGDGAIAEAAKDDPEYKDVVKTGTLKGVAAGIKHRLASVGKQRAG